jgi:hypothetical protein
MLRWASKIHSLTNKRDAQIARTYGNGAVKQISYSTAFDSPEGWRPIETFETISETFKQINII